MAKTLDFTDMSPRTVKIGDTTTSFTLICGNNNMATDLTNATSITVKLGNSSGYLKSATVDPASLTDSTPDQVTVTFTADLMNSLPAGSYVIEVWVVDSTGTSIYPSDGSTGFTITNNIQSANGSTITTITFDDFVAAMNKAASTIDKGDKGDTGDTGTVDNTGLISAPAFQSLQTQVNNSAVGTNLLTGTAKFTFPLSRIGGTQTIQKYDDATNYIQYTSNTPIPLMGFYFSTLTPEVGQVYMLSADVCGNGYIAGQYFRYEGGDVGNLDKVDLTNDWQRISNTFSVNTINGAWTIYANNLTLLKIKNVKIEKGSVATEWCPNPSEILTTSDYAKIKAAIVALGGALS